MEQLLYILYAMLAGMMLLIIGFGAAIWLALGMSHMLTYAAGILFSAVLFTFLERARR